MKRIDRAILMTLRSVEMPGPLLLDCVAAYHFWFLHARYYPALERLIALGWIRRREGEPKESRGGRPEYFYSLTDVGRAQ